jgi:quercetin dioxygenase-like cupin family protein
MSVLEVAHYFSEREYAKKYVLNKNQSVKTHQHNYSHLSILASGAVDIITDGVKKLVIAPYCIVIKAGVEHEIIAHKKSIFYCVHAIADADKEHIDEILIKD